MLHISKNKVMRQVCIAVAAMFMLQGCSSMTYVQRETPNKLYKDYRPESQSNAAVLGVGDPISQRQMRANATITMQGNYDVEQVMQKISSTYNLAVRWGNGVRRTKRTQLMLNQLTFDEARNYIEDVYDVQIIREGERRLLILPSASEPRLASFNPGEDVTLASAIKGLAEQCGYNLVLTENKQELNTIRVTTNLKDVTCFDAFEALLNPQGLSIINTGDYYTVGGLPQRQWTLDLYEPVRNEEQSVNLTTDFSGGSSGGGESGGSSGSQSVSGSNQVTIKYERNLWKDLEGDLNNLIQSSCPTTTSVATASNAASGVTAGVPTLLPPPTMGRSTGDTNLISPSALVPVTVNQAVGAEAGAETGAADSRCGYVRINQSVGVVQMRAPASVLDEANNIIQRVQDIASRRLLLEARVIAVSRTRGFNQDGRLNIGNVNNATGEVTGAGFGGSITSALAGELLSFTASGSDGTTYPAGGAAFQSGNLDAAVSLLERYGTAYTLMRPMMELMDRQRATLIDGRNEKYFIQQSESTTGTATTTSSNVEERSQFVGLQFSASAQIGEQGEPHTISLQIPITDIVKTIPIPNSSSTSSSVVSEAPIVNTRLIDQKVRVRDGEIKVIGGLTKTMAFDDESGLPILRDITALGKLVNSESIRYENVEFVVLLQVRRLS